MTPLAQPRFITVQEYLALEEAALTKHEYYGGAIYERAACSPHHAAISFNISGAVGTRLRGHRCRGASSDQRVKVSSSSLFTYPDVVVKCPPERYDTEDSHALLNPTVVFEVLSPSTAEYDRTTKFDNYQTIVELTDYVLIAQDRIRVEHYRRRGHDTWELRVLLEPDATLHLQSLDVEMPIGEFYEGLDLPSGLRATAPSETDD